MTKEDLTKLKYILSQPRYTHSRHLEEWAQTATVTEETPKGTRTLNQNAALHLDCKLIAEKLNDAGLDMRKVLKPTYNLPWTTESVKEHIFKPIMKALYHKESTTELKKTGEIEHIHETIMRELGEKHGIEWHDFPSLEHKSDLMEGMKIDIRNSPDYPEV